MIVLEALCRQVRSTERPRQWSDNSEGCVDRSSVAMFTFKFRRTFSMKNFQMFSLVSSMPCDFTSFLIAPMISSMASSANKFGISPDANISLINTKNFSSATCESVMRKTVPMPFWPALMYSAAKSVFKSAML